MRPDHGFRSGLRLLMLGFGVTGKAVCEFAVEHAIPICVSDNGTLASDQRQWLENHDITYEESGHTSRLLQHATALVLSPGIPADLPLLEIARQRGMAVLSEIDLALRLIGGCSVIAVTGTNGKTTTVEVITKILHSQGYRAWAAGNIGTPLIRLIGEISLSDVLVLEMSSYQLEQSCDFHPDVGVLLTLSPDHLHRHKTMQRYAEAKGRLFENQGPGDVAILPRALAGQFEGGQGQRVYYDEVFTDLPPGTQDLLPHERSNLRAALAACQAVVPNLDIDAVPMDAVCPVFRQPHRMEVLGSVDGITIVNDSKSTNAGSTIAALRSVDQPIVLLLGGSSKGAGYEDLAAEIAVRCVREVFLFGEAANGLNELFSPFSADLPPVSVVRSMNAAIGRGLHAARSGDILLLSPACSSFDAFTDFAARGEALADHVRALPGFEKSQART